MTRGRRLSIYCVLVFATFGVVAIDGIVSGWGSWMPGSMIRHRDAMAVAISNVAYGKTDGAAYKAVNRSLLNSGFDVRSTTYLISMRDYQISKALEAAVKLTHPDIEGDYFPFEETGMARVYTLAFRIFGIGAGSWFSLYLVLSMLSTATAIASLRQHRTALYVILCASAAHTVIAIVLPRLPQHDVMTITSNRFLGVLGSIAALHLMLMVVYRIRLSPAQLTGVVMQGLLLALLINARATAVWLAIALGVFTITALIGLRQWSRVWPIAVAMVAIATGSFANVLDSHPAYREGRVPSGHVFWHNLVTALHNNPDRGRYSIPPAIEPYDDIVSFIQFNSAIAARGESRAHYLLNDPDWIFRTTEPTYDFSWASYDRLMRDVAIETIRTDPYYAGMSFAVYQPAAAGRGIIALTLHQAVTVPIAAMGVLLAIGTLLLRPHITRWNWIAVLCIFFAAGLPIAASGVAEIRLIELFYAWLLLLALLLTAGAGGMAGTLSRRSD